MNIYLALTLKYFQRYFKLFISHLPYCIVSAYDVLNNSEQRKHNYEITPPLHEPNFFPFCICPLATLCFMCVRELVNSAMYQPATADYTGNGYHQQSVGIQAAGHRVRRGSRGRPRLHNRFDRGSNSSNRVSESSRQENEEDREKPAPPPCTDFDMAYFHSYAHVGIHEEMIKVCTVVLPFTRLTFAKLRSFCLCVFFFQFLLNWINLPFSFTSNMMNAKLGESQGRSQKISDLSLFNFTKNKRKKENFKIGQIVALSTIGSSINVKEGEKRAKRCCKLVLNNLLLVTHF